MRKILFAALLLSFPLIGFAQCAIPQADPQQPIQLAIKSNKQAYQSGVDGITINVAITNKSAESVYLFGNLSFSAVNNTTKQDLSSIMQDAMEETPWLKQVLTGFESINQEINFTPYNNLPKGKYTIVFSFNSVVGAEYNAVSEPITIEVTGEKR